MTMWLNIFSLKRSDDPNYAQNDRSFVHPDLLRRKQWMRIPRRDFSGKPD